MNILNLITPYDLDDLKYITKKHEYSNNNFKETFSEIEKKRFSGVIPFVTSQASRVINTIRKRDKSIDEIKYTNSTNNRKISNTLLQSNNNTSVLTKISAGKKSKKRKRRSNKRRRRTKKRVIQSI